MALVRDHFVRIGRQAVGLGAERDARAMQLHNRLRNAATGFPAFARLLDLLLLGPVSLAGLVMRGARRHGLPGRYPATSASLDRLGVFPVLHHYYEPLIVGADLTNPLDAPREIAGLNLDVPGQLKFLAGLDFGTELVRFPRAPQATGTYFFDNGAFESGDAELLYSIIRKVKPARLFEVGSGYSTLMARAALAKNQQDDETYECSHRCIEPFENPWLEDSGATIIRRRLEDVDPTLFDQLAADDILFIDSSHVIRPQGDVLALYLAVLGRLQAGVLVHIHDIFTPRDYPRPLLVTERRMWDEQYLLEAFLCFNERFEVVAALNDLWHSHPAEVGRALPVLASQAGREPGSFWIRVR